MYIFSFIVGNIIPKRIKCIHSATKPKLNGSRGLKLACSAPAKSCLETRFLGSGVQGKSGLGPLSFGFKCQGSRFRV